MKEPDGNVHVIPLDGTEHEESGDCWCDPELTEDYTEEDGKKLYTHRQTQ